MRYLVGRAFALAVAVCLIPTTTKLYAQDPHASMPNMPVASAPPADSARQRMLGVIVQRLLSDPVIRERAASDPKLQEMLRGVGMGMTPMADMHPSGISGMSGMSGMSGDLSREDQAAADAFMVRLLMDPAVKEDVGKSQARRRLFQDPDLQRKLVELGAAASKPQTPAPIKK